MISGAVVDRENFENALFIFSLFRVTKRRQKFIWVLK
jgi:hypothetical protein